MFKSFGYSESALNLLEVCLNDTTNTFIIKLIALFLEPGYKCFILL